MISLFRLLITCLIKDHDFPADFKHQRLKAGLQINQGQEKKIFFILHSSWPLVIIQKKLAANAGLFKQKVAHI